LLGVLEDGSSFTADQVMINPVEYELEVSDSFTNPLLNGVKGSYIDSPGSDIILLDESSVGYLIRLMGGADVVVGTEQDDVISVERAGNYSIDGMGGVDTVHFFIDSSAATLTTDLVTYFDAETTTYTISGRSTQDTTQTDEVLTASLDGNGNWNISGKEDAEIENNIGLLKLNGVESLRVFYSEAEDGEPLYMAIDLVGLPSKSGWMPGFSPLGDASGDWGAPVGG